MTKTHGNFTDFLNFSRSSSATYLDSDGLIKTASANVPRVEYDSNGQVKGLLIEEARTNLLPYSEDFSNAQWATSASATKSASAVVAPDGSQNAYELTYPSTSGAVYEIVTVTATVHSFSVWLKADEVGQIRLARTGLGSDGENVTVTTEWQRFDVQITPTTTSDGPQIRRDATDQLTKVYVWGAQLEQGSFPTSYIPTSGAAATRSADLASIDVDNFGYNQKAGTVVVGFDTKGSDGTDYPRVFSLSNSAGTDLSRFLVNPTNTTAVAVIENSVGVALSGWSGSISPNTEEKVAVSMKKDNFAASLSGASTQTDTSGNMTAAADLLAIGTQYNLGDNYLNGHIRSIKYLPRRLTNTQLVEFTS